jgi:hypothetical protein
MSYWVKAILGLTLLLSGLAAFEYGLYELMNIGTCASGGPYVSARECPEGTFGKALLLPGGLILAGIGIVVWALRGRRPGAPDGAWRASAWLVGWSPLFIGTGVVALVAGLGSDAPDASSAKWVGIFLAAMFIPMGLVPVLWEFTGARRLRRAGGFTGLTTGALRSVERMSAAPGQPSTAARPPAGAPPAPTPTPVQSPAAGLTGDPVERLRKLGELRDSGVLSPDEFAAAKSRILAEL